MATKQSKGPGQPGEDMNARGNGTDAATQRKTSKVKYEGVLAREEAVSYFEALIEGLKKGTLQLKQGGESIVLRPTAQVAVEVKAARKGDKEKLAFEITWRSAGAEAESDLKISAS
jgi:amphi-Trp domain-containing protein